jgi:FkbM family methyltransferase
MNIYPAEYEDIYKTHPITIVDAGASGGIMPLWKPHRQHLLIIGFEPDDRAFDDLSSKQDTLVKYFNFGLSQQSSEIPFYLTRKQEDSSCFLPNRELLDRFAKPNRFDVIEETTLKCRSLDEFLHEENLLDVDFVKLDTQGSELNILQGATTILEQSVFGLEIEVFFNELYKEAPLFSDIDKYLRKFGFELIDMRTVSWKRTVGAKMGWSKGQWVYADTLYFLQARHLQKMLEAHETEMARCKLLKAISICQVYACWDYGLELIDLLGTNFFTERELQYLISHIKAQAPVSPKIPNFPGKKGLAALFENLAILLAPRKPKKAQKHLGNF